MAAGEPVTCLVDAWMAEQISARSGGVISDESDRKVLSREFTNHEIALVVLSFLFASQDAMTSSIVNTFELLADHPEILEKVREEQYRVRENDVEAPVTIEMIDQMVYTRAMVKEALRVLPPVIMVRSRFLALVSSSRSSSLADTSTLKVPYMTLKPFPISADYTVPKGTMLIPSTWPSLHDEAIYPQPDAFIPERWLEKNGSAEANPKNYMGSSDSPLSPRSLYLLFYLFVFDVEADDHFEQSGELERTGASETSTLSST